jgi:hypothetical protein
VLERLVEAWLDSASERSYQIPFCQILAAKGHRIVHSSRHAPLELGKDVVSIGPGGEPWAFQLKGNPGGRMTLREYREIETQLHQLATLAIDHPSVPRRRHRAVLVTNGQVEEEVQRAIQDFNRAHRRRGVGARRLELIQRGDLLDDAVELGAKLWPSELADVNVLLELLVEDGRSRLPCAKMHRLLSKLLLLDEEEGRRAGGDAVARRITSAALLTAVATQTFALEANHVATVWAWVMFCGYAIGMCERHNRSFARYGAAAVRLGVEAIRGALGALVDEVAERDELIEGDRFVDSVVYRGRYTLLAGLLGLFWLWCEADGWPAEEQKSKTETFLRPGNLPLFLWGEGAIPQLLAYHWAVRKLDASITPDRVLSTLLAHIARADSDGAMPGLASPYFDLEDVTRHVLAPLLGHEQDPLGKESAGPSSYYAEGVLHLLVRTGLKQTCKSLWPELTKVEWIEFKPATRWQYCLWRTKDGRYIQRPRELTKRWDDLVREARVVACSTVPKPLLALPHLLLLWLMLFPHRANADVIRFLGWKLNDTWFIEPPIID